MATGEPYKIREEGTVGFAIIVANKFEGVDKMVRDGTHAEIKMLTEIFTKLGFEPKIFGEVTSSELLDKMKDIKDDPILKSHDMIALAICSHGKPGRILFPTQEVIDKAKEQKESQATGCSTYDANPPMGHGSGIESLSVREIQESVMSEYLEGKPKLVILNACRSEQDAIEAKSAGDRFTLYSTKLGEKSTKFELQDQGYVPMFLRKLYEAINNQDPHDEFNSIDKRINGMYDRDQKMKAKYEERSDMELNGVNNKILRLQLRARLEDLNNLFKKNEERDSADRSTRFSCSDNKNLTIPGTKCATSIAYNSKQPCYYICDPESSKIIVFLADFTEKREFLLDCRLEGPRYIQCISHEKFIFISHELGVARVDISDGKIDSTHKVEPLEAKPRDRVEDFISPCLAANEPHGILFILDRFSHNSDQKLRRIFVYNVAYREYDVEFIPVIEVSPEMKENYSPIITDMNFRQYNPEQQQLLILAYRPSPFLLIYTIGKKEFTFLHPPFLLRKCEPCFIASYLNYALISSPKAEKSITKINDQKEDENEKCKLLNIKNTQAILLHAGEKAIITAIEGDNCVIYSWEGITK